MQMLFQAKLFGDTTLTRTISGVKS